MNYLILGASRGLGDAYARLDVVVYNPGIWEGSAFSASYEFEAIGDEEAARVIAVILTGAINTLKKTVAKCVPVGQPKGNSDRLGQ